jgi:Lipoprotein LpqB beta-propeller domain/Sporulation and spore germination
VTVTAARATRATLVLLAMLLAVSGCTSIPTKGGVNAGTVQDPGAANPIGLFPAEPATDASPEEIVNGFLAAATGQQDRYRVAREFLAPALRRSWNPRAGVLITDGGTTIRQPPGTSTVTAAVPVIGRLDAHGVYHEGATKTRMLHFHVARVKGQWRIDSAADGIVLGQPVFDRLFEPVTLQFFDPTFRRLHPDLRRFPIRSDTGLATARDVVDALLAGPSAPLASGVTASPFPKGTRRVGLSLVGDDATVDLAVPGGAPATVVQQRMLAQLFASLHRVGAIIKVHLSIGGVPRPVSAVTIVQAPEPNPQPVGLRHRSFGVLEGSRVVSDVLQRAVGALGPSSVTISDRQGLAAVGTAAGISIVTRSGNRTSTRLVDRRVDLIAPALDPEGWVYSVPRGQPDALVAHDRVGHALPVATPFPAGADVRSIEVSRDGSRLLALLETGSGARALVAGIVRDGSGRPLRLTTAVFPVVVAPGVAVDATWVDPGAVATVTQDQDGDQVTIQQLGGESSSGGRLTGATDAVGGTSRTDLTIRTLNGALFTVPQGSVWVATGATADVLAVQR